MEKIVRFSKEKAPVAEIERREIFTEEEKLLFTEDEMREIESEGELLGKAIASNFAQEIQLTQYEEKSVARIIANLERETMEQIGNIEKHREQKKKMFTIKKND